MDNETPEPTAPPAPAAPPWGDDFDPAKAWSLVQNLRGDKDAQKARIDALQAQIDEAKPLLDQAEQLRQANLTDVQAAQEQLTASQQAAEAANTTAQTWRTLAVAKSAEALAASKFADADVGVRLLGDLSSFIDGDTIDERKLADELDKLVTDHPYLARSEDGPRRMRPNPGQGASGAALTPNQSIRAAEERGDRAEAARIKADLLLNGQ